MFEDNISRMVFSDILDLRPDSVWVETYLLANKVDDLGGRASLMCGPRSNTIQCNGTQTSPFKWGDFYTIDNNGLLSIVSPGVSWTRGGGCRCRLESGGVTCQQLVLIYTELITLFASDSINGSGSQ